MTPSEMNSQAAKEMYNLALNLPNIANIVAL